MRVLIVSHGFPPTARGGAESYAQSHATALTNQGDAVLVLTREARKDLAEFSVRRENRGSLQIAWINNTFSETRTFADTYTDDRIDVVAARLIDEFKPDVAHVHHLTGLSTTIVRELSARGIPVFATLHDYWLLCHRGQLLNRSMRPCADMAGACGNCLGPEAMAPRVAYAARALLRPIQPVLASFLNSTGSGTAAVRRDHMLRVMQGITHFFAPSRDLRDRFIAAGIDASRITVSEYGWSLPKPAAMRPPRETPSQRLGFLGSLMVSKAPHLLLEAAAGLPEGAAEVHVYGDHANYHGDASYRDRLQPLLQRRGVIPHGAIDRTQLNDALANLDVLVVPSIWPENSPLVIREAFLAGVPVVASRIGGIPETVTDDVNGLLFAPGDVDDLRRALRRLIEEPGLLARLQAGIPALRTVDDDVAAMRARYAAAIVAVPAPRRLAAIVLNYRTPADTFLAARSLLMSRRRIDHIIVVDNDPSGSSRELLSQLNGIDYLPTGANLGFAGGMNAGITRALDAGADAVLLVNSDVVVPAESIGALERGLYATPGAGIAGPIVLGRRTPDRIASRGINYNDITGRMRHRDVGKPNEPDEPDEPEEPASPVSAVPGCMMLIKREVLNAVGRLDPAYFFSFEDIEFCLRARDAGFKSIIVSAATALHEGGKTMGADSRRFYFGARNHLRLASRRQSGTGGQFLRSTYVVALNVAHAFRAPGGSLAGRLAAVAKGTRDYVLGRFGSA